MHYNKINLAGLCDYLHEFAPTFRPILHQKTLKTCASFLKSMFMTALDLFSYQGYMAKSPLWFNSTLRHHRNRPLATVCSNVNSVPLDNKHTIKAFPEKLFIKD